MAEDALEKYSFPANQMEFICSKSVFKVSADYVTICTNPRPVYGNE